MLPKILIVDDIQTNLILLEKTLSRLEVETVSCQRPLEALEYVDKEEFALMILDVMMPQMIGYDLADKIRSSKHNALTPIIFLTGIYSDNESIFKGYDSGAVDYITLPYRNKILHSKVKVFLNLYKQRKELDEKTKRLEKMIKELKEAEEQIVRSLVEGEDRERERVARDLHDGLGQYLTAASLGLKALNDDVNNLKPEKQQSYHSAIQSIDAAIKETRSISNNLMPAEVKDLGLNAAIENMINRARKSSEIKFKYIKNLNSEKLGEQFELHLYRISQEFINNTLKHSEATQATLQIMKHDREIIFTYEDNGKGFSKEIISSPSKTSGLSYIKSRVTSLGGRIHVDTKPGKGMHAVIELPGKYD